MPKHVENFRSLLDSDIGYLIKIVGVTVAVVMFIIMPQKEMEKNLALQAKDIDNISSNHLLHIQDSIKKIEEEQKLRNAKDEIRDLEFAKHIVMMENVIEILKAKGDVK